MPAGCCARTLGAARRHGSPAAPAARSGPGAAGCCGSDADAGRRLRWSTPGRPRARPPALCSPPLRASRVVLSRRSVYPSHRRSTRGSTSSRTKRPPSAPKASRTSRALSALPCSEGPAPRTAPAPAWRVRRRCRRRPHRRTHAARLLPLSRPSGSRCHRLIKKVSWSNYPS